jgi:hypothetical protein
MGTRGHLPGVKRPQREADDWQQSSVKVKNDRSYIPTSPDTFMTRYVITNRETSRVLFLTF